nr:penicillin-binding protein activator [Acetobacter vaccinii]
MMTRAYSLLSGLSRQALAVNATLRKPVRQVGVGALVLGGVFLAGCADDASGPSRSTATEAKPVAAHKVGVLLPLSGPNAALGRELLAGAQLALTQTAASPTDQAHLVVDVHDTAAGAGAAANAAVQAGDGILLGPLTSGETSAAAPTAVAAGVPMLAFTSDVGQARSGVWVMGITPEDQVQALVEQARREGRQHFAALLPDNPLGRAMGGGLQAACHDQGLPAPDIIYHTGTATSIAESLRQLSAYESRAAAARQATSIAGEGGAAKAEELPSDLAAALGGSGASPQPASTAGATAQAPAQSAALGKPPFDALLLGDTGLNLKTIMTALADTQVAAPAVRIMGPGLWAPFSSKLGNIRGAWYAAPDPAFRQTFVSRFVARNQHAPKPLADLSYDAASVARAAAQGTDTGFQRDVLTRHSGFPGVDGRFYLLPDGRVRRALAIFEVQGAGVPARILALAPVSG